MSLETRERDATQDLDAMFGDLDAPGVESLRRRGRRRTVTRVTAVSVAAAGLAAVVLAVAVASNTQPKPAGVRVTPSTLEQFPARPDRLVAVTSDGALVEFDNTGHQLRVVLPAPAERDEAPQLVQALADGRVAYSVLDKNQSLDGTPIGTRLHITGTSVDIPVGIDFMLSPDGKSYARFDGTHGYAIVVGDVATGTEHTVYRADGFPLLWATWSSDGTKVYVYSVAVNGSHPQLITADATTGRTLTAVDVHLPAGINASGAEPNIATLSDGRIAILVNGPETPTTQGSLPAHGQVVHVPGNRGIAVIDTTTGDATILNPSVGTVSAVAADRSGTYLLLSGSGGVSELDPDGRQTLLVPGASEAAWEG